MSSAECEGGEVLVPAPVPVEIMARAWHDIVREDADNAGLQGALRNLVSWN
jgi:ribose 5-phosphate isomerase